MKTCIAVILLAGVFTFSWFAFEKVDKSKAGEYASRVLAVEAQLKALQAEKNSNAQNFQIAQEEIKLTLTKMYPNDTQKILLLFVPPKPEAAAPTTAPAATPTPVVKEADK